MSRSNGVSWATRGQIIAMVGLEGLLVTVTGVLGGTIASLFTVLPFQNARAVGWLPSATLFPYAVIIAIAAALTAASTIGTTRRII
jgi:putative ABC transport system permease protein